MRRTLKVLLVMIAAVGLSGYARVPEGEVLSYRQWQTPVATARAQTPAPTRPQSREPSELTLLLCGFVVVGVIARRKARLVAG